MSLTEKWLKPLVLADLRRADAGWLALRQPQEPPKTVIEKRTTRLTEVLFDVAIAGGTLGILLGAALAKQGFRVALIERGMLRGRAQEWNISRSDLDVFVELELLTPNELEQAMVTRCTRSAIRFPGAKPIWVEGVLDIGIDPIYLLAVLKGKFLLYGGQLFENTAFAGATLHPNGVQVGAITCRLLVDAMGHLSAITQQARKGQKPEGICLVVGSCAQGFAVNNEADLIASLTPIINQCQYLWEAFPARDGRTTYLFTYVDTDRDRPSLEALFEDYLRLLSDYQGTALEDLQIERALFGLFPAYQSGGIGSRFERILAVGDSSGSQSPLSFGGFGAMVRHLKRLTFGISESLQWDCLGAPDLDRLQPYQPNLAVTWLFQKTMCVEVNQKIDPDQVNRLLWAVFIQMESLGTGVLRPFLQDVVQFPALTKTLLGLAIAEPGLVAGIVTQVGSWALLDWSRHYLSLGTYSGLYGLFENQHQFFTNLPAPWCYKMKRWLDAWEYGSGSDLQEIGH
jgi:lycopene cyclase CruP